MRWRKEGLAVFEVSGFDPLKRAELHHRLERGDDLALS
jgi:hypothetical protein